MEVVDAGYKVEMLPDVKIGCRNKDRLGPHSFGAGVAGPGVVALKLFA